MLERLVLTAIDERGIATLTLNRPEVHNAYNGAMVDALIEAVDALAADERVRLLMLRANGKHFQAGADLAWLREVASCALEDNVAFSRRTTLAMRALNAFPRPTSPWCTAPATAAGSAWSPAATSRSRPHRRALR
jgi:methylglutaconyl-CoA hydratase